MKTNNRHICILLTVLIILSAASLIVGLDNSVRLRQLERVNSVVIEKEDDSQPSVTQKPSLTFQNATEEEETTTEEITTAEQTKATESAQKDKEEPTTAEKSESDNSSVCYVTASGTKYHRNGCSYLKKSKTKMTVQEAKDCGYSPCSRCY